MFDAIASRYDLLNRVLSLGIDQRWRRRAVGALALSGKCRVLDVATGTGDLALAIARTLPQAEVVGIDPSPGMLAVAERKLARCDERARIRLEPGVVEELPFADSAFDGVTIAFGIRNAVDRGAGLREMRRVTRAGGRVVVLELAEPEDGLFERFARFYIRTLVPLVGGALSGSREYRYLQQSIAAFPRRAEFSDRMRDAGLEVTHVEPLTFGVANLFVGRVP
jgi:demethylmenaquinone methyltransferase/2-methoxy-6-polyprenyl-1,4-benzoquinol methylase